MCVIIHREPGVVIPQNMLETACDINKDGFGLSWGDKKGLHTLRSTTDNNANQIQTELAKLSKYHVFLHLRHATVGAVTEVNSHPFFPLVNKKVTVGFMHNGTLSKWKPVDKDKSDTWLFSTYFLANLLERSAAVVKNDELLNDGFIKACVENQVEGDSVFFFFDNHGHTLKVGRPGKKFEGWWASNDYSFDTQHWRSSKRTTFSGSSHSSTSRSNMSTLADHYKGRGHYKDDPLPFPTVVVKSGGIQWGQWETEASTIEVKMLFDAKVSIPPSSEVFQSEAMGRVIKAAEQKETSMNQNTHVPRHSFTKLSGIEKLTDVGRLTKEQLEELIQHYPKASVELIVDLVYELTKEIELRNKRTVAVDAATATPTPVA